MSDLIDWINEEVQRRGWTYNELARRSGLSSGYVSLVLNERQRPGFDFCVKVARAFGKPPERVLRLAGLLPPMPPEVEEAQEAERIIRSLPRDVRAIAMQILRSLEIESSTRSRLTVPEPDISYQVSDRKALDPYVQVLGELWDKTPDWKKRDIVTQLRSAVEEYEREQGSWQQKKGED